MAILKIKPVDSFEIFERKTLQDPRLELQSLGALTRLCSLPPDWEWHLIYIQENILFCGRDARKKIFLNLEKAGYLFRKKRKNKNGRWEWEYELSSVSTIDGFTVAGETGDGDGGDKTNKQNIQITDEQITQQPSSCLIYPPKMSQEVVAVAMKMLEEVDSERAQQMLDTLSQNWSKIKNPISLLYYFVNVNFIPNGHQISAARRRKREIELAISIANSTTKDEEAERIGEEFLKNYPNLSKKIAEHQYKSNK